MQRLMLRSLMLVLTLSLLGAAACGPNRAGTLPVSSPVYGFDKPDAEDLVPEEEEDDEADVAEEE